MGSLKQFSAGLPHQLPLCIEKNLARQFHIKRFIWEHLYLPFRNNHFFGCVENHGCSDDTKHSCLIPNLSLRDLLSQFFPELQNCGLWQHRTGKESVVLRYVQIFFFVCLALVPQQPSLTNYVGRPDSGEKELWSLFPGLTCGVCGVNNVLHHVKEVEGTGPYRPRGGAMSALLW